MPMFETMEDALTYVRYEISKQKDISVASGKTDDGTSGT